METGVESPLGTGTRGVVGPALPVLRLSAALAGMLIALDALREPAASELLGLGLGWPRGFVHIVALERLAERAGADAAVELAANDPDAKVHMTCGSRSSHVPVRRPAADNEEDNAHPVHARVAEPQADALLTPSIGRVDAAVMVRKRGSEFAHISGQFQDIAAGRRPLIFRELAHRTLVPRPQSRRATAAPLPGRSVALRGCRRHGSWWSGPGRFVANGSRRRTGRKRPAPEAAPAPSGRPPVSCDRA